jgi:hypothetical protein
MKLFFESFCGEVSLHGVPYFRPCLKISCYGVLPVRAVWKRTFAAEPQISWQCYGNCLEMECAGCTTKIAGGLPSFYTNHIYRVCDGLFIFSHQWPTSCHRPKLKANQYPEICTALLALYACRMCVFKLCQVQVTLQHNYVCTVSFHVTTFRLKFKSLGDQFDITCRWSHNITSCPGRCRCVA